MTHSIPQSRSRNPMWLYEHNYALLRGLFPLLLSGEQEGWQGKIGHQELCLRVVERFRYTLTLDVHCRLRRQHRLLGDFVVSVRVYEDAGLAEVLDYQHLGRRQPVYPRRDPRQMQVAEKDQLNRLFRDWLNVINLGLRNAGQGVTVDV
ncbi:MAG TPA: DUF1249 domain-containing protein [Gammaproteobacteria bacterium]|nr:DUF1249 domain-containing protein [Gammaproteobacteria bacterium]